MDDNATFLAGGPITCGGNWTADTGAAFVHNNGTVTFNGTGAQAITTGSSNWNDIIITNASAGGVTFTDGFTCSTFINTTAGSTLYFAAGQTVTITAYEGLILTGAESNLITLRFCIIFKRSVLGCKYNTRVDNWFSVSVIFSLKLSGEWNNSTDVSDFNRL